MSARSRSGRQASRARHEAMHARVDALRKVFTSAAKEHYGPMMQQWLRPSFAPAEILIHRRDYEQLMRDVERAGLR